MQRQLIFQLSNVCAKHSKELGFICTFPNCNQIELCAECHKQHSARHPSAYIQSRSNWLRQMETDIDQLSQFTKQINLSAVSKNIESSLSVSRSVKNKSESLAILVENIMKCITDERNLLCHKMNEKAKTLNEQSYKKIEDRKALLNYFSELGNNKSFQIVFFLLSQKGWVKMKKRLKQLNLLAADCKTYIGKAAQVIKQFQDIAAKLQKHQKIDQLAFLHNIEKLVQWKQNQIKMQEQIKQRNHKQKNEPFASNEIKLFKDPPKQVNIIRENQKLQFKENKNQSQSPRRKRARTIFGQKIRE